MKIIERDYKNSEILKEHLKEMFDGLKLNDTIIISITNDDSEDIDVQTDVEHSIDEVFNESIVDKMTSENSTLIIASENMMMTLKSNDIEYWRKRRKKRLKEFVFGIVETKVEKAKVDRFIAVCWFDGENLQDIEPFKLSTNNANLKFINSKIEDYFVRGRYKSMLVCVNYVADSDDNEWLTLEELEEKGYVSQ